MLFGQDTNFFENGNGLGQFELQELGSGAMEATTKLNIWGKLGEMTKNITNNLMEKIPDIAGDALGTLVQAKLSEKILGDMGGGGEDSKTQTIVKREIIERQVPVSAAPVQPTAQAAKEGLPGWVIPAGIGAAVLVGLVGYKALKK